MKTLTIQLVTVAALCSLAGACGSHQDDKLPPVQTAAKTTGSRLELVQTGDDTYALSFQRGASNAAPRVMEVVLEYAGLTYESSQRGDALATAGKDLIAQTKEPGRIRLLGLSSSSVAEIQSGTLATIRLRHAPGTRASVRIVTDRPMFAPATANDGLAVSDPINL